MYSETMLFHYAIKYLFLIEHYLPYFNGETNVTKKQQKKYYLEAIKRLRPFKDRYHFLIMASKQVATIFPDNFFDYVYIDGNHRYESVKQDIKCWYNKTKLLAGHDYCSPGVQCAVKEFVEKNNLLCMNFLETKNWLGPDWLITKKRKK